MRKFKTRREKGYSVVRERKCLDEKKRKTAAEGRLKRKQFRRKRCREERAGLGETKQEHTAKGKNMLRKETLLQKTKIHCEKKYAAKRKSLKEANDYVGLQKLPKNASPVRLHNRCKLTGRPKGYIRQFGISRVMFREMANKGLIPGVTKASW